MPTPSEQKALAFVAIVILLGGAVRVLRAGSPVNATDLEQQAVARQATAVDSAAARGRVTKQGSRSRGNSRANRDTLPNVVGGVSSVPPSYARPDQPFARSPIGTPGSALGFPAPNARIDTDFRGARVPGVPPSAAYPGAVRRPKAEPGAPGGDLLDMDLASASEIERLPGIGPTFANRIIANRDSLGPFRGLEGLRRVKGIGPAKLQKLAPLVTFSGTAAPGRAPLRY